MAKDRTTLRDMSAKCAAEQSVQRAVGILLPKQHFASPKPNLLLMKILTTYLKISLLLQGGFVFLGWGCCSACRGFPLTQACAPDHLIL